METNNERDDFRDENQPTFSQQNENYSQSPDQEDENGAGGELDPADERERANDGDWQSIRERTRTDNQTDNSDMNDNSGGAGSTGSEATNSGNPGTL